MYQKHWLSEWYVKFLSGCGGSYFFWYRVGQIQITDSTFCNSSSINCCKPSKIQDTLFLGLWRRWQSIKGNEPADLSSLSQREITMHVSKWNRKRSHIRKRTERKYTKVEIFFGIHLISILFLCHVYYSPSRENKLKVSLKKLSLIQAAWQ